MIVSVIQKKTLAEIADSAARIDVGLYDLIELRLDGCIDLSPEALANITLPLPAVFTLRSAREGGAYTGTEQERLEMLERLAALKPAFLDVEAFVPADSIARIRRVSPETRIILSSHDFSGTPENLEGTLELMRAKAGGVIYKIAAMARNTPDALRMLLLCKKAAREGVELIGISMGEYGECTRILAPVFNLGLSYCPLDESTAPGQLGAATLRGTYNFARLNKGTTVYGLLGDPVAQSVGHLYHNRKKAKAGCDAVYVKWRVAPSELEESVALMKQLGVSGASVTMPLKEAVMPCLACVDESGKAAGAVNTLKLCADGYSGTNTDGPGALDILPLPTQGLNMAIIGAGGAARAIIYEAVKRGARVTVYNRTAGKELPGGLAALPLKDLAGLERLPCDVIINTLPFDADFDFSMLPFRRQMLCYDISYAGKSRFLELAAAVGCRVLDGGGMFEAQAALQRRFWGLDG